MSATPDIDTVDQNEEELQRQSKLSKQSVDNLKTKDGTVVNQITVET